MHSLKGFAVRTECRQRLLPSGKSVSIDTWTVSFPPANPAHLPEGVLPKTYTNKPLVQVDSESLFGELAILRWLQKDGWDGVWVDTFHDRGKGKLFWQGMPHETTPYGLTMAPHARAVYDRILAIRGGKAGGFFDVLAWKGSRLLFVEYKGRGDRPNRNESLWIDAALEAGVKEEQMVFVVSS